MSAGEIAAFEKTEASMAQNQAGDVWYPDSATMSEAGISKLMKHFGSDQALVLIDERAERAADRGNYEAARRWRDLITAIHALEADERSSGDSLH